MAGKAWVAVTREMPQRAFRMFVLFRSAARGRSLRPGGPRPVWGQHELHGAAALRLSGRLPAQRLRPLRSVWPAGLSAGISAGLSAGRSRMEKKN